MHKLTSIVGSSKFKALLFLSVSLGSAQGLELSEDGLKSVYLFNFAKYTTWPEPENDESSSFIFCIYKSTELYAELQKIESKTIRKRDIEVRRLEDLHKISSCDLLYYSDNSDITEDIITDFRENNILTVGEHGSPEVITFKKYNLKLIFDIDLEVAKKRSLRISSELLKLADKIK